MLRPETIDTSVQVDLLADRPARSGAPKEVDLAPWKRVDVPDVAANLAGSGRLQAYVAPVPIKPEPVVEAPVVYVPPPRPVAPTPRFTYLGRLDSDEETRIFLAVGDAFESVPVGGVIDGNWRIKHITDEGIELEYLPLRETRWLSVFR
ncbi:MAG: hypothetical protein Q8J78_16325 [Moraxellaceae bacterium]|nr:hypothetical protein [Moraxellaceae bacterium]